MRDKDMRKTEGTEVRNGDEKKGKGEESRGKWATEVEREEQEGTLKRGKTER